ncbi:unnamed protein product [Symbiodinium sp. CCMP2592]|nr:unnamed protein product [Symbiodinium sp. CCMP2592]
MASVQSSFQSLQTRLRRQLQAAQSTSVLAGMAPAPLIRMLVHLYSLRSRAVIVLTKLASLWVLLQTLNSLRRSSAARAAGYAPTAVRCSFRFAADSVFALQLLQIVSQWKESHRPGRPHPLGAGSTAVAHAMLLGISTTKTPPSCNADASVAREFSHCSAQCSASCEERAYHLGHCRPAVHGRIFPDYNVLCQFLESFDAERLDRKPADSLLRKVRQQQ